MRDIVTRFYLELPIFSPWPGHKGAHLHRAGDAQAKSDRKGIDRIEFKKEIQKNQLAHRKR